MKRFFITTLLIIFVLSGCGVTPTDVVETTPSPSPTQTEKPTEYPKATPWYTPDPTPLFTMSPLDPTLSPVDTPAPTPEQTAAPTTEPTDIPTTEPTVTPSPTLSPIYTPEPTPTPGPTPAPPPAEDYVEVKHDPPIMNNGVTYTGLPALAPEIYYVTDPDNKKGLNEVSSGFGYGYAKDEEAHSITKNNQNRFDGFGTNALAWDNKTTGKKVMYLTFDAGYKYKETVPEILDILKEKGVPAAFFCTLSYIKSAPDEVARMINEGHTVGNHSATHPSDCATLTKAEYAEELLIVNNYLRVNFGYDSNYFRFPTGTNSEEMIDLVNSCGLRSIFWSIAHADWDPENQPGVDVAFNTVTGRFHPGAVILLHTTAPDNVAALGAIIDKAIEMGYEFRSLDEYEYWN